MKINEVRIEGRIDSAPQVAVTKNGLSILKFSIVHENTYKGKTTKQFVPIVCFGDLAVNVAPQITPEKNHVIVFGKVSRQPYKNKKGEDAWDFSIMANDVFVIDAGVSPSVAPNKPLASVYPTCPPSSSDSFSMRDEDLPF